MRGSDDSGKAEFLGGKPDPTLSSSQQWTFIKLSHATCEFMSPQNDNGTGSDL